MSAIIPCEDYDSRSRTAMAFQSDDAALPMSQHAEAIGFVAGTRVATPIGYVAVERLSEGDRVLTADGRHARLTWVGMTCVTCRGAAAPVRFEAGVLDNIRPLRLGQGHRVRVLGWRAELLFDADAVLATAKSFVNGSDILIEDGTASVTYVHLMFDNHEVVLAENVACETLRPGPEGLNKLEVMSHDALISQYPDMSSDMPDADAILPLLSAAEERILLSA
jgi:hypothetical protein